ncbi:MAG TPA: YlmC/YmxH family sporulation protein [Bacillota bacterium]|nr:YlmC/YmxH family sporulation protein [Clostridiales bacterium]HPT84806.1 YlmC/YmxH family sporulation protein [Bacillota bacterium]
MSCCISDLRDKEIINICDGVRLGYVVDIEVDVTSGRVISIVASGECRSLFGKSEEVVIPWECVERIGDETILVRAPEPPLPRNIKLEKKKFRIF